LKLIYKPFVASKNTNKSYKPACNRTGKQWWNLCVFYEWVFTWVGHHFLQ